MNAAADESYSRITYHLLAYFRDGELFEAKIASPQRFVPKDWDIIAPHIDTGQYVHLSMRVLGAFESEHPEMIPKMVTLYLQAKGWGNLLSMPSLQKQLAESLDALKVFHCSRCNKIVSYDEGCLDDTPGLCDACANEVQALWEYLP